MKASLVFLLCLTLMGFAANSLLVRAALKSELIDPASFTIWRLCSGAVVLFLLVLWRGSVKQLSCSAANLASALTLLAYATCFSFAYINLDAGLGALLLFASVQLAMSAFVWFKGQRFGLYEYLGFALALSGLVILSNPFSLQFPLVSTLLMIGSGVAWAAYSLLGQGSKDAISDSALAFMLAGPLSFLLLLVPGHVLHSSQWGIILALASGAVCSALAYALWYSVLPKLKAQTAAVAQLSVPLITAVVAFILLAEPLGWRFIISAVLILGGIAAVALSKKVDKN
ncbi:DMT family transporter [Agaribacterium sp. ZY112]|uniref:DMT family transporter n=1 Tax=Agaribacterium sp. ZY112 TaxID=3233574 RepID=UPI0035243B25